MRFANCVVLGFCCVLSTRAGAQLPANPEPIARYENLAGLRRLSLSIDFAAAPEFPDAAGLTSQTQEILRAHGATLLPTDGYPKVRLSTRWKRGTFEASTRTDYRSVEFIAYALALEVVQQVRLSPGAPLTDVVTWRQFRAGHNEPEKAVSDLLDEFVASWVSGNPPKLTTITASPQPILVQDRLEYATVPWNFLPAVPFGSPGAPTEVVMKKSESFALTYITTRPNLNVRRLTGDDRFDAIRRRTPDKHAIYLEDFEAMRSSGASIIECRYGGTLRTYLFWLKTVPAVAVRSRLAQRWSEHPMLQIGGPIANCPLTYVMAEQAGARALTTF